MKQFKTVFKFTYMDAVRKKSFRVSTIIMFVIILILCLIPRLADLFGGEDTQRVSAPPVIDYATATPDIAHAPDTYAENLQNGDADKRALYYLDAQGLIPRGAQALEQSFPDKRVVIIDERALDDARAQVAENGGVSAVVVTRREDGAPNINVLVKDFMSSISTSDIERALSSAWSYDELISQGVTDAQIALAQTTLFVNSEVVGTMDVAGYTLGIVFTMIMFFSVYFYGLGVANSVSTEKTSRVMETLVVSAKPRNILVGKCVAMGVVGLTQLVALLLFSFGCYKLLIPSGTLLFGMELSFSGLTFGSIILLLMYFLTGYALYALLYAVSGASVSRIEDVSSALMPVSTVAMIGFYVGYLTTLMSSALDSAGGIVETLSMYVPFCAPFGMPFRILNQSVTGGQIALSLSILLVTIVITAIFTTRLYAAGVMFYGKRLKIKDMFKLKP